MTVVTGGTACMHIVTNVTVETGGTVVTDMTVVTDGTVVTEVTVVQLLPVKTLRIVPESCLGAYPAGYVVQ